MARTDRKVGYSPTGKLADVTPDMAAAGVEKAFRMLGPLADGPFSSSPACALLRAERHLRSQTPHERHGVPRSPSKDHDAGLEARGPKNQINDA